MTLSKKGLNYFFNGLLWFSVLFYLWGGGEFKGRVRFSHVNDVFAGLGCFYIISRIFWGFRLSQTQFGKVADELFEAFSDIVKSLSLGRVKKLSFWAMVLGFAGLGLLFLFLAVPILNYWSYGNHTYDLGIIENSIFNAVTTGKFATYFMIRGDQPMLYFPSNRLNFGLFPLAALYSIFRNAEILLLMQSLALLAGLIPLFKLSDLLLPKEIPRWFPLLLYWCWDPIHRMNLSDFHETPFMIPCSLWFFYFLEKYLREQNQNRNSSKRTFVGLLSFLILTAVWREDAWWVMAGQAFYAGIRTRRWGIFLPLTLLGLAVLPIYTAFFNQVNSLSERYSFLGSDFRSAFFTILSRPWVFLQMAWKNQEFFKSLWMSSGGGIFLFSGWGWVTLVLPLLELSQSEQMSYFGHHYVGLLAGPLFYTTLIGWKNFFPKIRALFSLNIAQVLVACSWVLAVTHFYTSESGSLNYRLNAQEVACLDSLLIEVPPEVPLIASDPFSARLAQRHWITGPEKWIQLSESEWKKVDLTLAHWLIVDQGTFHKNERIGQQGRNRVGPWRIVAQRCGFVVATR